MDKNPFEIRLELITNAKDILFTKYFQERERLSEKWVMECDFAKINGGELPVQPTYPDFPTHTQIIDMAKSFNEFVSNKY